MATISPKSPNGSGRMQEDLDQIALSPTQTEGSSSETPRFRVGCAGRRPPFLRVTGTVGRRPVRFEGVVDVVHQ